MLLYLAKVFILEDLPQSSPQLSISGSGTSSFFLQGTSIRRQRRDLSVIDSSFHLLLST